MKEHCKCGSTRFEKVDVTPSGCTEQQYFVRCRKCGLVTFSSTRTSATYPLMQWVYSKMQPIMR